MTTVVATLTLQDVDAATLTGVLAGYSIVFTEATSGAIPAVSIAINAESAEIELQPGTWSATVTPVDAAGAPVGTTIASNTIVLAAPTMVKVPMNLTIGVKQ